MKLFKQEQNKKKGMSASQQDSKDDGGSAFGCIWQVEVQHCETNEAASDPAPTQLADVMANLEQGNSDFAFLKECFLLDTGSSMAATIQNEKLVCNIRDSNNPSVMTTCLLYTSPSPRDLSTSRMPSSA